MQGRHVSKIRVAATELKTEPRGQVKLATDHRPSMGRPWISALAFKRKKKKKEEEEESDNQGIHTHVPNLILFLFFISSLLWFVVWETEARAMPLSPTLAPFFLGKLNSPGVCGRAVLRLAGTCNGSGT